MDFRRHTRPHIDTAEHRATCDEILRRLLPAMGTMMTAVQLSRDTGVPKATLLRWMSRNCYLPKAHHQPINDWIERRLQAASPTAMPPAGTARAGATAR